MIMTGERQEERSTDQDGALHVLETLAARHRVVPLTQITLGNPWAVSQLITRLVDRPSSNHPWLPVGTLGPFLILGHFNPASTDFMNVPDPFCVKAVIDTAAYEQWHSRFLTQWARSGSSVQTIARRRTPRPRPPVGRASTVREMLHWFTENYPFTEHEHATFLDKLKSLSENDAKCPRAIDELIPQLGVALETLRTGELAFDPACAPPLTKTGRSRIATLQRHRAYPLLESPRTRYWPNFRYSEDLKRAARGNERQNGSRSSLHDINWPGRSS